jgi:agmatinase
VAVVGVRGAAHLVELIDRARDLGINVFPMSEVDRRGIDAVIEDALSAVSDGTAAVYVSFDNDAVDPSHAPGTTAPEPGGSRAVTLFAWLERLGLAASE